MKTALVRCENKNLKIIRDGEYNTIKEMRIDLMGNGYKVLKIWNGNISDRDIDEWELLNRK